MSFHCRIIFLCCLILMMTDSIKNEMWNLIILHKSMYIIAFVKKKMRSLTWYILSFYFCGWWKLCLEYRYDFLFSLSEVNICITVTSSCNSWQVLKNKNTSFFNIIVNKCVKKRRRHEIGPTYTNKSYQSCRSKNPKHVDVVKCPLV